MSGFQGFPRELFTFLEELEQDNTKAYWTANRATWEEKVRKPMRRSTTTAAGADSKS